MSLKGNMPMFPRNFQPISKLRISFLIREGSMEEWYAFMRDIAPFVIWELEAAEQIVTAERHPRECSGMSKPYAIYSLNSLRTEADAHADKCVPNVIRNSPMHQHWKIWVCNHDVYRAGLVERMDGDKEGRIAGLAFSVIPSPPEHEWYLTLCGAPTVLPTLPYPTTRDEMTEYVRQVNLLRFPGTNIPVIPWFISFLHWTRFDGDSISLVNVIAMFTSVTNPNGYPPQAVFHITGPQRSGKSNLLSLLQQLRSPFDLFFTNADSVFRPRFTGGLEHAFYVIHEATENFARDLNSCDRIRTMVTEPGPHAFEWKGKAMTMMYGMVGIIAAGDRRCIGKVDERRLIEIVCPGENLTPSQYEFMSKCIQVYMILFADDNADLIEFRRAFKQSFVNLLGLFHRSIQPNGIEVPNLFRLKSYFAEAEALEQHGSAVPPAKRRRTVGETDVPEIWRIAVKTMLDRLAKVGHPFPMESIDCFDSLFSPFNLQIFTDADGQSSAGVSDRGNILTEIMTLSYQKQVIDGKTLQQICEEYREDQKLAYIERRNNDGASKVWFMKALAHFRKMTVIEGMFHPDDNLGSFYPRRWHPSGIIWFTGLWLNFLRHSKNSITTRDNNYIEHGGITTTATVTHFPNWVYVTLFNRRNRGGGSNISLGRIGSVLGIKTGSLDGTIVIRSQNVDVGPFVQLHILRELDFTFNPRATEIEAIKQRCKDISKVEQDMCDKLMCCSKDMTVRKLTEFLRTPGWRSQVSPKGMVYYQIYQTLYANTGLGVVSHDRYTEWTDELMNTVAGKIKQETALASSVTDLFDCDLMDPSDLRPPGITSAVIVAQDDGEMRKRALAERNALSLATTGTYYKESDSDEDSTDSEIDDGITYAGRSIECSQSSSGIGSQYVCQSTEKRWGDLSEERTVDSEDFQ